MASQYWRRRKTCRGACIKRLEVPRAPPPRDHDASGRKRRAADRNTGLAHQAPQAERHSRTNSAPPRYPPARFTPVSELAPSYFAEPPVLRRIYQFMGGRSPERLTCRFFTADDRDHASQEPRSLEQLAECIRSGMGIARSLWDNRHFLVDLDIEYVNFDFAAEPYLHHERSFALQGPVVEIVRGLLRERGIRPLHLYSGRGHHFVWQISRKSTAFASLVELGEPAASPLKPQTFQGEPMPAELTAAFCGLGLVMESLGQQIKQAAAAISAIPVELTALQVGPGERGREMISIDISEYGDPLQTRAIRVPFTPYLKPWQQPEEMGPKALQELAPLLVTPLPPVERYGGFAQLHEASRAVATARCVSTRIPLMDEGMENLISHYLGSPLRIFHEFFYSRHQTAFEEWPSGPEGFPLEQLPPCAQMVLSHPNDLLLKPWGIRLVTRSLLALGWHPRHISGLVRTRFEGDYGWGERWTTYDPGLRADFYTRIFAGLFMAARDDLVDFNCTSSKEERTCLVEDCHANLAWYRDSALARRRYGYLADRPFNRLFLPNEHL